MKRTIVIAALVLALVTGSAWAQGGDGNLLENPGFEGGWYEFDGVGELTVPESWRPWHVEGGDLHRPEYKPETVNDGRGRVRSGGAAAKQFTTFAKHQGGIYQVIYDVTPGEWYTFSAWVYVWSSGYDDPDQSAGHGKYSALVGINPWGDERAWYRTTVWGREALAVYNQWVQVSVTAQAWTDKIAVFTYGTPEWPVKHNDSYWDDANLVLADLGSTECPECPACPTPEPCPTCPPCEPGSGEPVDYDRIDQIVRDAWREMWPGVE